ncbi:hypothetical protein JCM11251_000644 [Rhodosporidiobolus azoricus]
MDTTSHLTYSSLPPHPARGPPDHPPHLAQPPFHRQQPPPQWGEAGPSNYAHTAGLPSTFAGAPIVKQEEQPETEVGGGNGPPLLAGGGKRKKPAAPKGKKRLVSAPASGTDGTGGAERVDKDGNVKKKRKQLVACDSCRLRRVKCDKAEKEGGACSECEKKSITCTDSYVKNRPKVVRSGKLIAQAKLLYGDPHHSSASPTALHGAPISPESAVGGELLSPVEDVRRASAASSTLSHVLTSRQGEGILMGSQIGQDMAEQLIHTFLTHLQPQCPLFDQDSFLQAYESAGRITENLPPAHECLALVMQAWAARFSDHSLILGPGAPSLADVRSGGSGGAGGGRDCTIFGNRRDTFAKAMADRAVHAVDRTGLLRTSSAVACAALTLLEFLLCFDDVHRTSTRGRYILSGAVEHLRNLQLGQCDEPGEECLPPERAANGTLLWFVYTRDASASMFGGRNCSLTDDDLALLCDLFVSPFAADVQSFVSSTDPRMLSGIAVASIFRRCVTGFRNTVTRLTGPLARRSRLEESVLHELWTELDETARLSALFRQSVASAMLGPEYKSDIWFRDLVVLRSQHTLGIHLSICARLAEEEAAAALAQEQQQPDENGPYLELLRGAKRQSDVRLLTAARELTELLRGYGSELLNSAAYSMEYTTSFLKCMVESLTLEQGGGLEGWTWANKVTEVSALVEVLKLVGWCWADYDRAIEYARSSLAEQAAFLQQAQQQQPPQHHDRRASDAYSTHPGYQQQVQLAFPPHYQQASYSPAPHPSAAYPPPSHQPGDRTFSSLTRPSFPVNAPAPSSASYAPVYQPPPAQQTHTPALPPTPIPSPGHPHHLQPQQSHHGQLLPPVATQEQQHLQPLPPHYAHPPHSGPAPAGNYITSPVYNGAHGI